MSTELVDEGMVRSAALEETIATALEAAVAEDYDRTLRQLAFAFTQAANLRQARGPRASRPSRGVRVADRPPRE